MKVRPEVAKKYMIDREWRNTERDKKTQMKHVMDGIVAIDKNDVNLSNANMSSHKMCIRDSLYISPVLFRSS